MTDDRHDNAAEESAKVEWQGEERRSHLRRRADRRDRPQRRVTAAETLATARRDWAQGSYLLG